MTSSYPLATAPSFPRLGAYVNYELGRGRVVAFRDGRVTVRRAYRSWSLELARSLVEDVALTWRRWRAGGPLR